MQKIYFKKRIPEPELMNEIEYLEFSNIFLKKYYQWTIPILEDIKKFFNNKDNKYLILDAGCGPGYLTKELGLFFKKSIVYGLDYSKYVIDLAKKNCSGMNNIKFVNQNILKTKFKNNFFDLIICKDSLHHFKNINNVLKEMLRILKQNGIIYIQDLRRDTPFYILKTVIPPNDNIKKLIYYSVRSAYTKKEILNILRKNKIKKFDFKIKKINSSLLDVFKRNKVKVNLKNLSYTFKSRFILIIKK